MSILPLTKIRDLTLDRPAAPGRPGSLSAASGLVPVKSWLYVVADDEHHLGVFAVEGDAPGRLIRILDGDLPGEKAQRKRLKPDFEVLLLLPPFSGYMHGALFAIGSGSTQNRQRGVLLALDEQGSVNAAPRVIDLSALFAAIGRQVGELNIEGAVIAGDRLVFLQRGNKGGGLNALVSVASSPILLALAAGNTIGEMPFDVCPCDLGTIGAIPLTFTDGAALPDGRIVFSAVAEDTDNSYLDGVCAGSAVGVVTMDGLVEQLERLPVPVKVEGIDARLDGNRLRLLLVTDADDAHVPASLYVMEIEIQRLRRALRSSKTR